jgi:AcrR family transcriptional regulator
MIHSSWGGTVPRTRTATARHKDEQRARILDAARSAFARRGLQATMADVAAAAGISQGLAYRYFAGKDELIRALLEEGIDSGALPDPGAAGGTAGERLRGLVATLVDNRRRRPELFELLHHAIGHERAPADLIQLVEQRGREFRARLRELIVEAQAAGEVAGDDPDQLVTAVSACLDGLSRAAVAGGPAAFPATAIVLRLLDPSDREV